MNFDKFDLVDAAPTRRHAENLRINGLTQKDIATQAGVARETVVKILAGQEFVARNTARAVLSVELPPVPDPTWVQHAACRGQQARQLAKEHDRNVLDLFFIRYDLHADRPMRRRRADLLAQVRAICDACPVRDPCRDHAVHRPELHGLWGGHTEQELIQLRKQTHT
jgi:transcriptional regulator with XRE-family HTH domain